MVSSLNYSLLTLQQLSGPGSLGIATLSGGTTTSTDGTVILIKLPKADLDSVKLETQLCIAASVCHVTFPSVFVTDMAGNNIQAVTTGKVSIAYLIVTIICGYYFANFL